MFISFAGSSKAQCLPFVVAGQQVGHVSPSVAKSLHRYPAVFSVSLADEAYACVELNEQLVSYKQRTSAVQGVLKDLREQQAFPCLKEWREEVRCLVIRKGTRLDAGLCYALPF